MENTINPGILIPIVLCGFIGACWLTASFCNHRWTEKLHDVKQDLKTSAQHLEQYRKLYSQSDLELRALQSQLIRVSDAKATMNNRLVLIRKSLSSKSICEVVTYIMEMTAGFEQAQVLENPPKTYQRGAHTVFIDKSGDAKIKTQQL